MKRKSLRLILALLVAAAMLSSCGKPKAKSVAKRSLVDMSEESGNGESGGIKLSDDPVEVYDGHLDTVVMIYMVGSDLESENNLGTIDLYEIGDAIKAANDPDASVKVIVETGGCSEWATDFDIDPEKLQRYEV